MYLQITIDMIESFSELTHLLKMQINKLIASLLKNRARKATGLSLLKV